MPTCKPEFPAISIRSVSLALVCGASLFGTALIAPVLADTATVYRCTKPDGSVILSGTPCGPDAKKLTIEAPSAGTGSEESIRSQAELARQYDAEQRARRKADARARALRPRPAPPRQAPPNRSIYLQGGYLPYPYYRQPGWSIHGSGSGWRFDVDSGLHHRPPPPTYPNPSNPAPSTFFDPMPAYLAPEP